jgi:hypothetical protein
MLDAIAVAGTAQATADVIRKIPERADAKHDAPDVGTRRVPLPHRTR